MLERLVFFSDAVFAIAITLLIVEIHAPHIAYGPNATHDALAALEDLIPKFIGFFVSFFVTGAFWALHHRTFGLVGKHDPSFVRPNLLLLASIALLPFSTAFMSENNGQFVPHLFYLANLLATGLLQVLLVHCVLQPQFLEAGAEPAKIAHVKRRIWALPLAATLGILVNFVAPGLSTIMLLATPLFIRLLSRG